MLAMEHQFEESGRTLDREAYHKAKALYLQAVSIEEEFLLQQSGIKWSLEGDKSRSFFHSYVKRKRRRNTVHEIYHEGEWLKDQQKVVDFSVVYFRGLFCNNTTLVDPSSLLDIIPPLVSEDDNIVLMKQPDEEEVKQIVFSMDAKSVAGSDGFNGRLYQSCWSIICDDLVEAVRYFFHGSGIPRGVTSTILALIPKCEGPKSWKEYRPISLCNFFNKIILKILSSRLSKILLTLISPSHGGFVKGRQIQDNSMLAHELAHHIDRKIKKGNVIMKLDMTKAFDKVSW
ncbi:hypothetical protein LIER_36872 [Lithospermum erythrorhizon]|uniref:Reverse transcriptase domain-containing protein n=1 Tax=Lithospermum erythrorhizon TaxID=34254 RepID=A0AAV3PBW0_LITER